MPTGRPLTNSTTSGLRVFRSSVTVNWLTASQSLLAGLSKSMTRTVSTHSSLRIPVLDLHAVEEYPVKVAVAGFQGRTLRPGQLAEGIVQRGRRQRRVECGYGISQPSLQHNLAVVSSLGNGRLGSDVGAVRHLPAKTLQPVKGRPARLQSQ